MELSGSELELENTSEGGCVSEGGRGCKYHSQQEQMKSGHFGALFGGLDLAATEIGVRKERLLTSR
jgi:hypothetical protein